MSSRRLAIYRAELNLRATTVMREKVIQNGSGDMTNAEGRSCQFLGMNSRSALKASLNERSKQLVRHQAGNGRPILHAGVKVGMKQGREERARES